MFYTLGNILSPQSRRTEQTDTRQEIHRHDPEYERRKGQKQDKKDEINLEDGAIVSVEALKDFLENFVRERTRQNQTEQPGAQKSEEQAPTPETNTQQSQTRTPLNTPSAQAASAYAQSAHMNDHSKVLLETTDKTEGPALDLSAADMRTLHVLIEDLKTLQNAKIEIIKLEPAASFLDSLVSAVNKVKSGL